jgi:prepilin-type N-terminal cleavage/methylation domain-containing protein
VSVRYPPCARNAASPAPHRRAPGAGSGGFSLIEIVVVIVLLAIIAGIAIPRLSRGSEGSVDAAISRDLSVLQKAIDLYAAEHDGAFPDPVRVTDQLTRYTDLGGTVSSEKVGTFEFGPYVRRVPVVKAGPNKGSAAIATQPAMGVGWIYNPVEGTITANTSAPPPTQSTNPINLPVIDQDILTDPLDPLTTPLQ